MSDTRVLYKPYIIGGASTSFVVPAASTALGIGDVVPGATFYAGLRVYSTAKIGANAIFIRRETDLATATLIFKSNGFIDCSNVAGSGQTLSVWRDAAGAGTLTCRQIYEQISGIASGASACVLNIVDETKGVLSLGSDTNTEFFAWVGLSGIQTSGGKFSMLGTVKHVGGGAASSILGSLLGATNWTLQSAPGAAANTASAFQNTSTTPVTATASDDAWHGLTASMDNANSFMYVDATKTSTSTGSADNIGDNSPTFMGLGVFNPYQGRVFEGALYGTALSDAQASAIAANIVAMIISAGLT